MAVFPPILISALIMSLPMIGEAAPLSCSGLSLLEVALPLHAQCAASEAFSSPLHNYTPRPRVTELDEAGLDRALDRIEHSNSYMAVLFYASWCPFSKSFRSLYDHLSALYPNIHHVAVEEAGIMPSVLSRFGVHSFPSLFLLNQTTRIQYHRRKDSLPLLLDFYSETTGNSLPDILFMDTDARTYLDSLSPMFANHNGLEVFRYSFEMTLKQALYEEPYLVAAVLFLILRVLIYLYPKVRMLVRHSWLSGIWHWNMALLRELTLPLLKRTLNIFNLKRVWSRFKFSKRRNFQEGAKNARVWASLASVSLGNGPADRAGCSNGNT
eukprot:TRINITY_DN4093_c0_g2_i1.p1 TRINITY_DN4093_c0_g2~~TRINITY_DN4093_c0_g2_i1.p1  ORF type:complete len:325 (+),score=38.88 TRINITY_DN4093_c0_g2_i1:386-1360(+)